MRPWALQWQNAFIKLEGKREKKWFIQCIIQSYAQEIINSHPTCSWLTWLSVSLDKHCPVASQRLANQANQALANLAAQLERKQPLVGPQNHKMHISCWGGTAQSHVVSMRLQSCLALAFHDLSFNRFRRPGRKRLVSPWSIGNFFQNHSGYWWASVNLPVPTPRTQFTRSRPTWEPRMSVPTSDWNSNAHC